MMRREAAEEKEEQTLSLREGRREGDGEQETWWALAKSSSREGKSIP